MHVIERCLVVASQTTGVKGLAVPLVHHLAHLSSSRAAAFLLSTSLSVRPLVMLTDKVALDSLSAMTPSLAQAG